MDYEDLVQQFANLTSAERLQKVNLMWPSLHPEIQMCVLSLLVAILGPEDVAAISHTIAVFSDKESQDTDTEHSLEQPDRA
jgi:hypothetical protein